MRMLLAAFLWAGTPGCVNTNGPQPSVTESIVRRCGLAGQIEFERVDDKHLAVSRLDPNSDYDSAKCVLNGLEARGIQVGFIAQEQ
jgi:hypothetical protein